MNATTTNPQDTQTTYDGSQTHDTGDHGYDRPTPPLQRPAHDRMLVGVASGAARYLGVDPAVVRIIFAVLVIVGGIGIPLYLAGWLLIPEEGRNHSLASELIDSFQSRSR